MDANRGAEDALLCGNEANALRILADNHCTAQVDLAALAHSDLASKSVSLPAKGSKGKELCEALVAMVDQDRLHGVASLLSLGADVNWRDPCRRLSTPLAIAAKRGHFDVCLLLLAFGADETIADADNQAPQDVCTKEFWLALNSNTN